MHFSSRAKIEKDGRLTLPTGVTWMMSFLCSIHLAIIRKQLGRGGVSTESYVPHLCGSLLNPVVLVPSTIFIHGHPFSSFSDQGPRYSIGVLPSHLGLHQLHTLHCEMITIDLSSLWDSRPMLAISKFTLAKSSFHTASWENWVSAGMSVSIT